MKAIDKAIEVVSYNEKYDKKRLAIAIRQKIKEESPCWRVAAGSLLH